MLSKPDAKFCSQCGKSQGYMPKLLPKKQKTEDGYKSPHGPSARMFHPYNGRQDFTSVQPSQNLMDTKVVMTPLLQKEMEHFKSTHPNMTDLELQQEFGL
jgi:hypothetical protein